jgi:aliphatic sulfonates family ABC transporter substrate-binding protein
MVLLIVFTTINGRCSEKDETIKFAFQDRIGSVIPIIAVKKGFFIDEGLKIKPLRFNSGPACAEALYSGAADIAEMGDTASIIFLTRNPLFVIIASHATGEHRHRIMVRNDSTIQSLNDLKGKRLGVKKGTSTYGGLLSLLVKANISVEEIGMIDLEPSIMTEALLAGSLDAFAASEPTPSIAEQKGARELTTLGGLGNEYPVLILANGKTLKNQKNAIQRFFRAMKKAELYVSEKPEETADIIAAETGLTVDTTKRAMKQHEYHLRIDSAILSSLEQTALFLKGQKIITKLPDLSIAAVPD